MAMMSPSPSHNSISTNSLDPDEAAQYERPYLDLIVCGPSIFIFHALEQGCHGQGKTSGK